MFVWDHQVISRRRPPLKTVFGRLGERCVIVIPIITKREIYGCYPFESGPFPLDSTPLLVTFPFDSLRALPLRLEIDESGTFSAAQLVDNGAFSHVLKLFSAFYVPQIPFFWLLWPTTKEKNAFSQLVLLFPESSSSQSNRSVHRLFQHSTTQFYMALQGS